MPAFQLLTIGLYGFTEETFFATLQGAGVDVFCDVRRRRGVRGRQYAFANSRRLQERLKSLGITYIHFKELSPTEPVRDLQRAADAAAGIGQRQRQVMSPDFAQAYTEQISPHLDADAFRAQLGPDARAAVLFCVEQNPVACHRSLLAAQLAAALNLKVINLAPPGKSFG